MKSAQERLAEIQSKSQKVIQHAIQINTKIEAAQENYQKLLKKMETNYQKKDISELEEMVSLIDQANEENLVACEQALLEMQEEVRAKSILLNEISS